MPKVLSRAPSFLLTGPVSASDRIGSQEIPAVERNVLFPPSALRGFVRRCQKYVCRNDNRLRQLRREATVRQFG